MIKHFCNQCKKQLDNECGKVFFEVKKIFVGNWLSIDSGNPAHLCSVDCIIKFFKDKNA